MNLRVTTVSLVVLLAACGGGGGAGAALPAPAPTGSPSSAPALPASSTQSATFGSAPATLTFPAIQSGVSATVTLPAANSGNATATMTLQSSLPSGAPVPAIRRLRTGAHVMDLGGNVTALAYLTLTLNNTVTEGAWPAFALNFPSGTLNGYAYLAFYDPANTAQGWIAVGPAQGPYALGSAVTFASVQISPPAPIAANTQFVFAIVETGSPLPVPSTSPAPSPSTTPTASPTATPTASSETLAITGGGSIAFYPVGAAQPSALVPPAGTASTFDVVAIGADAAGDLFGIEQFSAKLGGSNELFGIPAPYTGAPAELAGYGLTNPIAIAVTPQSTLFVAPQNLAFGTTVDMYTPQSSYATTTYLQVPTGVNFTPYCLALDGQGDLFATSSYQFNGDPGTLEWAPPYTGTPVQLPFGGDEGGTYAQGANCAIDTGSNDLFIGYPTTIDVYAPPYNGAPTAISENTSGNESFAAAASSHDLFVANGSSVDVYAPPYTSLTTSITSGVNQPDLVAVDASGNLFVGSTHNGTVTEYASPYTSAPVWTATSSTISGAVYLQVIP